MVNVNDLKLSWIVSVNREQKKGHFKKGNKNYVFLWIE